MPDWIPIGLCVASIVVALWATLAMLKQKKNTHRTDELELSMEAVARDVAVAYETLSGDIAQIRQETAQAVQGEQEKIASLINGLGAATNQVLRELAGAQEAQATAAEEARALLTARQADLTALVTGLDTRMAELTAAMTAQTARRAPKKPDPTPEPPQAQQVPEPVEELPEEPQDEQPEPQPEPEPEPIRPASREPARSPVRESAVKRPPAPRKAIGKKSVRKPPR